MSLLDKISSKVDDISESVGETIDKEKSDSRIREAKRNIDKAYRDVGEIVVRCLIEGKEIDQSLISEPYERAVTGMKNVTAHVRERGPVDPDDPYMIVDE